MLVFILIIFIFILFFILQYPVYFAFEDDNIDDVLTDIKRNDATSQPATATTGGLVDNFTIKRRFPNSI